MQLYFADNNARTILVLSVTGDRQTDRCLLTALSTLYVCRLFLVVVHFYISCLDYVLQTKLATSQVFAISY